MERDGTRMKRTFQRWKTKRRDREPQNNDGSAVPIDGWLGIVTHVLPCHAMCSVLCGAAKAAEENTQHADISVRRELPQTNQLFCCTLSKLTDSGASLQWRVHRNMFVAHSATLCCPGWLEYFRWNGRPRSPARDFDFFFVLPTYWTNISLFE